MASQQPSRTKFVLAAGRAMLAAALAMPPALAAAQSASIEIGPTVPQDIPGGAPNADLTQAAIFAWQEFIALNWPAAAGGREMPDKSQFFGQNGTTGGSPLVWETMRAKVELFPGNGSVSQGPHGWNLGPPSYGYSEPPAYVYNPGNVGTTDGTVAPCPSQQPPKQPAWVNLDEVTQIGLDSMYAGVLPSSGAGGNTAPQLIRFMAKANATEYTYVVQHDYWYKSQALRTAQSNFINAVNSNQPPKSPYVFFLPGTIETKAAWRPLGPNDNASHFHTATVRFYETGANGSACYFEAQWALIALHIIQKTPTAPAFTFATFEQAENITTATGAQVEDADGKVIAPQPNPTTPAQSYEDSPTNPQVSIVGSTYCTPRQQLFYHESSGNGGLPTGGDICVAQRFHDIPSPIVAVNTMAHSAIANYTSANKVANSPWAYYKLANVQAQPFDKTQVVTDPTNIHNAATFYQANGVVETDYTLQNFNGRIDINGAPTDYTTATPPQLGFKNVYLFSPPTLSVNMGGCMGCHGIAQSTKGSDFSFILAGNTVRSPETPSPASLAEVERKYRALLQSPSSN